MECSALSLPQQFSEFHACPPKSFNARGSLSLGVKG